MSQECSLRSIVQFMSQESSLRPHSTVYVPKVQFISHKYSSFPITTVYVPRVQFMFPEYSTVYVPKYSL